MPEDKYINNGEMDFFGFSGYCLKNTVKKNQLFYSIRFCLLFANLYQSERGEYRRKSGYVSVIAAMKRVS